jgi:hypothetical protein
VPMPARHGCSCQQCHQYGASQLLAPPLCFGQLGQLHVPPALQMVHDNSSRYTCAVPNTCKVYSRLVRYRQRYHQQPAQKPCHGSASRVALSRLSAPQVKITATTNTCNSMRTTAPKQQG